jgi:hypothetical protein
MAHKKSSISLGERVATAFVSMLAATLTLLIVPLVLSFKVGDADLLFEIYSWIFSKTGIALISAATVTGFFLGAERMVDMFSHAWGTHPRTEEDRFANEENRSTKILVLIVFLGVLGYAAHRLFNT